MSSLRELAAEVAALSQRTGQHPRVVLKALDIVFAPTPLEGALYTTRTLLKAAGVQTQSPRNWDHLAPSLGADKVVPHTKAASWRFGTNGRLETVIGHVEGYHQTAEREARLLDVQRAIGNIQRLWEGKGDPAAIVDFAHHHRLGTIGCTYSQMRHMYARRMLMWLTEGAGARYGIKPVLDGKGRPDALATMERVHQQHQPLIARWEPVWKGFCEDLATTLTDGHATKQPYTPGPAAESTQQRVRLTQTKDPQEGQVQVALAPLWDFRVEDEATQRAVEEGVARLRLQPHAGGKHSKIAWVVSGFWMNALRAQGTKAEMAAPESRVKVHQEPVILSAPIPQYPQDVLARLEATLNGPRK